MYVCLSHYRRHLYWGVINPLGVGTVALLGAFSGVPLSRRKQGFNVLYRAEFGKERIGHSRLFLLFQAMFIVICWFQDGQPHTADFA